MNLQAVVCFVRKFAKDHNLSSHSIVSCYLLFTGFVAANERARDILLTFLNHHPVQSIAYSFLAFAYAKYSAGHTIDAQANTVAKANAQNIP